MAFLLVDYLCWMKNAQLAHKQEPRFEMFFQPHKIFVFENIYNRQSSKLAKAHLESRHHNTTGSDFKDSPNKRRCNK